MNIKSSKQFSLYWGQTKFVRLTDSHKPTMNSKESEEEN